MGILVKRTAGGKVSNYLNDSLVSGDVLKIFLPSGGFVLDYDADRRQGVYVILAGGSGITPLLSLMKSILYYEPHSRIYLLYGSRHSDDILLQGDIEVLREGSGGRLSVLYVSEEGSGSQERGVMDEDMQRKWLSSLPLEEGHDVWYLLCGPAPMRKVSKAILSQRGVSSSRIREESFVGEESLPYDMLDAGRKATLPYKSVDILLQGKRHSLRVHAEQTLLEAGLAQGINMPFSCQNGVCTTCRGRLLSGILPHNAQEKETLSEEERAQGYVLCCQSKVGEYGQSEEIVVRIE